MGCFTQARSLPFLLVLHRLEESHPFGLPHPFGLSLSKPVPCLILRCTTDSYRAFLRKARSHCPIVTAEVD